MEIPARGQETIGTEISIQLPTNTYSRITPRSSLAVRNRLIVNPGVIDVDYTGEIRVVLANLGEDKYIVNKGDRIAQLIMEKILNDGGSLQEVDHLQTTKRGSRGFGSTGLAQINKQPRTGARLLSQKSQLLNDIGLVSKSAPVRTRLINLPEKEPRLKDDYLAKIDPNSALPSTQDDYISMPSHTTPKEPLQQEGKIHISEISARALGKFHRKGETTRVL